MFEQTFKNIDDILYKDVNFVLDQYVKEGVNELDDEKLPALLKIKYSDIADAKAELGEIKTIRESFINFQEYLYRDVAA